MDQQGLSRFYTEFLQDIRSEQLTIEEGGSLEQLFSAKAIALLAEGGETADVRISYHESIVPRNRHKINAIAIADNYETLDLFVTVFKCTEAPVRIKKSDVDTASKLLFSFLKKADNKEYVNSLEESSEIYDFAHTLNASAELRENLVRINIFIITDGIYSGAIPSQKELNGIPVFFRVIDLNYLFNISEKEYIPIEIEFEQDGFEVPCIKADIINSEYQSYLALIPGEAIVCIYEQYGARLLEQNIRSFLQFNGKINKGIRNTILKEPHMFLAFNNGIAATAADLRLKKTENGYLIESIKDFQIVNGGQTTASIYHTWKKDKADLKDIVVQVKLSIIKDKNNFAEIVSRIAEYANTQNKVSLSDLSSNTPFHVEFEKLSRNIWAPPVEGQSHQTRWFYERARGQYRNERLKEGITKSRLKAFDLKNPKNQLITKELLAKYINSWNEVYIDDKMVIGPHIVVRGSQKNYAHFITYNSIEDLSTKYFEDAIAKAIVFRKAEKLYGIKPNSIGDMRYITVPYALALLNLRNGSHISLGDIWRKQSISEELSTTIYNLMWEVEQFIKNNAPGALYGEWAKKEECWLKLKSNSS